MVLMKYYYNSNFDCCVNAATVVGNRKVWVAFVNNGGWLRSIMDVRRNIIDSTLAGASPLQLGKLLTSGNKRGKQR